MGRRVQQAMQPLQLLSDLVNGIYYGLFGHDPMQPWRTVSSSLAAGIGSQALT